MIINFRQLMSLLIDVIARSARTWRLLGETKLTLLVLFEKKKKKKWNEHQREFRVKLISLASGFSQHNNHSSISAPLQLKPALFPSLFKKKKGKSPSSHGLLHRTWCDTRSRLPFMSQIKHCEHSLGWERENRS